LRLNPPQIAVGIPNRGQRDREPRRVSQPLFCVRASRCLVDVPPTMACIRSHDSRLPHATKQSRNNVPARRTSRSLHGKRRKKWQAASFSPHDIIPSQPTRSSPVVSRLQSPSHFALGWPGPLYVDSVELSILFPPPPRDARDSPCAERTRAAGAERAGHPITTS